MTKSLSLMGVERFFDENDVIVSKTDLKGRITYANRTFLNVAGYRESELLGQPHGIIRHLQMPRAILKFLWDTIEAGQEIFGYVVNRAKNGDHYWVFAHVTPSYDLFGKMIGYRSNRRVPDRHVLEDPIIPLYRALCEEEARHVNGKEQLAAGYKMLVDTIAGTGLDYDEFIASLTAPGKHGKAA
ncbi:PAS domain-containing protein [Breoghania sp.]|uniref:PAS domain-containing protein n=1 Tax=Breoghania sp. TaxID=2065378 RepID=UPI0026086F6F|nr:PAS domain-containing protein [Breoghania sp.]MDJ0930975.1 PAS domain-containing protein [Breoghania sp.]